MTRPLLLGHRGARAARHIPENTLASFELSLQHGCDGFEFDVRGSSDGIAVICHDPVSRGLEIEKMPAKVLALPTLQDVLRQFASRAFLDIELKVGALEAQTIAALREHPPQKGYVISSFQPDVLTAVHELAPHVPLGLLFDRREQISMEGRASSPAKLLAAWMIPHIDLIDRKLTDRFHAAGKKVMVWTANRAEQMRQFADWGVDAIISDETEVMVRSLP